MKVCRDAQKRLSVNWGARSVSFAYLTLRRNLLGLLPLCYASVILAVSLPEQIVHRTQRLHLQLLDRVVALGNHIANLGQTHIGDAT